MSLYFTATSTEDYDRHQYKVVFKGGKKAIYCDSWESAQNIWFQWAGMKAIETIEVCDIKRNEPLGFR